MLHQYKLLVWDECTMSHKKAIEALDRTIKDIKGNRHIMGGMVVLLAGNFRQTLPLSPRKPAPRIASLHERTLLCVVGGFLAVWRRSMMDSVFFQTSLFSRALQCDGWLATMSDAPLPLHFIGGGSVAHMHPALQYQVALSNRHECSKKLQATSPWISVYGRAYSLGIVVPKGSEEGPVLSAAVFNCGTLLPPGAPLNSEHVKRGRNSE
ncbi:hypothetical protein EVAR_75487_1 [Eumeta japonica]|uniref:ATP-dependent DNA helicase n=1 Tax=Eumeta variegata TaxID=151549 RepID=A0A4C1TK55_EUMVA|nr:hypothetical protein EVAR_75487_1 [Eumeta japonica]